MVREDNAIGILNRTAVATKWVLHPLLNRRSEVLCVKILVKVLERSPRTRQTPVLGDLVIDIDHPAGILAPGGSTRVMVDVRRFLEVPRLRHHPRSEPVFIQHTNHVGRKRDPPRRERVAENLCRSNGFRRERCRNKSDRPRDNINWLSKRATAGTYAKDGAVVKPPAIHVYQNRPNLRGVANAKHAWRRCDKLGRRFQRDLTFARDHNSPRNARCASESKSASLCSMCVANALFVSRYFRST